MSGTWQTNSLACCSMLLVMISRYVCSQSSIALWQHARARLRTFLAALDEFIDDHFELFHSAKTKICPGCSNRFGLFPAIAKV